MEAPDPAFERFRTYRLEKQARTTLSDWLIEIR